MNKDELLRFMAEEIDADLLEKEVGDGWVLADELAAHGVLPVGCKQWTDRAKALSARTGKLPREFWHEEYCGRTYSHLMASTGALPVDFDRWDLEDTDGHTVAHVAASNGSLPIHFNQWELTNGHGVTVFRVFKEFLLNRLDDGYEVDQLSVPASFWERVLTENS